MVTLMRLSVTLYVDRLSGTGLVRLNVLHFRVVVAVFILLYCVVLRSGDKSQRPLLSTSSLINRPCC